MKSIVFAALLIFAAAGAARGQTVAGDWIGTLSVNALKLRIVFHLTSGPDGLKATMDSVDQNVKGIAVTTATQSGSTLTLEVKSSGVLFTGQIDAAGATIQGTWTQGPRTMPLVLTRLADAAALDRRPQDPVKPYPYREEQVTYPNSAAGITLAATLTLPEGRGPFPAILLIGGSGPHDRDEGLMGHRPFLVLADRLTREGIAVLRADKRGVAKSGGNYAKATIADFASDAEAGLSYLAGRAEIDHRATGLLGHSEGGIVAPMVAARRPDVAFIVMLAGSGVPGEDLLVAQVEHLVEASGGTHAQAVAAASMERETLEIAVKETDPAALKQKLADHFGARLPPEQLAQAVAQLTSPWMQSFLTYDPATDLRRVTCPVLALIGSKDVQVPADQNLPAIRTALAAGGDTKVQIEEVPGVNHLFQTARTGAPSEYGEITETMAPAVLDTIAKWVARQTKH